jgi:hypothetical protein
MADSNIINEKAAADVEMKEITTTSGVITPQQIQARFETLRDKSEEQMAALNKKLLRKIDWRLMPCITLMFLMKYVPTPLPALEDKLT